MDPRLPAPDSQFARIIAAIVSAIVLVASFFVGAVLAIIMIGAVALTWIAMAVRLWLARRRFRAAAAASDRRHGAIEGDYRVVDEGEEPRR